MFATLLRLPVVRAIATALPMVLAFSLAPGAAPSAKAAATRYERTVCSGGVIAPGVYPTLLIAGSCTTAAFGLIRVLGDLTIGPAATFTEYQGRVEVGGNVNVGWDGTFNVGAMPWPDRARRAQAGSPADSSLTVDGDLMTLSIDYHVRVTNNSAQFQDLCVYQKPVDLAPWAGSDARVNGTGGYRSVVITGVTFTGTVMVEYQHDTAIDLSHDRVGGNMIVIDDRGTSQDRPDLSDDSVGGALDCSQDSPPPTDDTGADHAAEGLHGQCRQL